LENAYMSKTILSIARVSIAAAVAVLGAAECFGASVPSEQSAIVQRGFGGPEVLKLETVPVLEPGEGQVLVQIYAAGVNPVDWKSREGINGRRIGTPAPADRPPALRIPGSDIAGVVVKLGPGVTDLKVGDPVAGSSGGGAAGLNGSYSHYALATASRLIPKPKNLTYAEAAGLGVSAGTPALAIYRLQIKPGQTLLITGVAGGVGSAMAQLAKVRGARVIGTASARHNAFLTTIGVDQVVDYTQDDWASKVKNVDAVFDTVGGMEGEKALGTLRKGGQFIGIANENGEPSEDQCTAAGVVCVALRRGQSGDPTEQDLLRDVGRLANEGKLKIKVDKTFPLEQAGAAQELSREGHTEGKIILVAAPGQASGK
jgi:NADPH:quinone reductase-like Zn-dependent oxidoreductase